MSKAEKAKQDLSSEPLEKLLLDRVQKKYSLVPLVSAWAKHLKQKEEECRQMTLAQLLDRALRDVLTGQVTDKHLKELLVHYSENNNGPHEKKKAP